MENAGTQALVKYWAMYPAEIGKLSRSVNRISVRPKNVAGSVGPGWLSGGEKTCDKLKTYFETTY